MEKYRELLRVADEVEKITKDMGNEINKRFEKLMFTYALSDGILEYEHIKKLPVGSEVILPSSYGCTITAIKEVHKLEDELKMVIKFDDYGVLMQHKHPDADEIVTVLGGSFRMMIGECKNNSDCSRFNLIEGKTYKVPAGVPHQFTNIVGEGALEVVFKKV